MSRNRRRVRLIYAAIFAVTLLLYGASLWQWRLYQTDYSAGIGWNGNDSTVEVSHGRLIVLRMSFGSSYISWPSEPSWRNAGGFSYERRLGANGKLMAEHVAVPLYPLPVVGGLLFAWHTRRRRAWLPGRCAHCGYDLRATPDRCPECGHPAEATAE